MAPCILWCNAFGVKGKQRGVGVYRRIDIKHVAAACGHACGEENY